MGNEFEHIDKIIREKFSGFAPEPPASAWEKIRKHISGSSGGTILFPILTITGLILVIVSMLVNDLPSGMHHSLRAGDINQQPVITPRANPAGPMAIIQSELTEKDVHYATEKAGNTQTSQEVNKLSSADISTEKINIPNKEERNIKAERQQLITGNMTMFRGFIDEHGMKDLVLMPRKSAGDYYAKNLAEWSFGLWFNPEVNLHANPGLENNQSLALHLSATVRKGNLLFQTGIGMKDSKDRGNHQITYNEYLGSYQHVYEVTYDSTENGVVPTYHTTTEEVYDTIPHYAIRESRIHYRYLEIPLMAGYQLDFKKMSMTLKGGLNTSILLNSNARNISAHDENIRVISEEEDLLERTDINLQIMVNAGINYRVNSQFSLGIEPAFRYYLNSEYKNLSGRKGSLGLGVRAGIIYHINP